QCTGRDLYWTVSGTREAQTRHGSCRVESRRSARKGTTSRFRGYGSARSRRSESDRLRECDREVRCIAGSGWPAGELVDRRERLVDFPVWIGQELSSWG